MTSEEVEIGPCPIIQKFHIREEGAIRVHAIDPEQGRPCRIPDVVAQSDAPERLWDFGDIHHGRLVRELGMDAVHARYVRHGAALGAVADVQVADVGAGEGADVVEPEEDGEEAAAVFDEEDEGVVAVEEGEALGAGLLAGAEEGGVHHDVFEAVEAGGPLGVAFDGEGEASREEGILPGGG